MSKEGIPLQSVILTKSQAVVSQFLVEHPQAKESILTLENFCLSLSDLKSSQILNNETQLEVIASLRSLAFKNVKLPKGFDHFTQQTIQSLKKYNVSPKVFEQAAQSLPFLASRRDFFLKIAILYKRYFESKSVIDQFDLTASALKKASTSGTQKILVLAHELNRLERNLLDELSKQGVEVDSLSKNANEQGKQNICLYKNLSFELEIETLVGEIEKSLAQGVSPTEIYVFCFNYDQTKSLLAHRLNPYKVAVMPWSPNNLVFPNLHTVFLCGLRSYQSESLPLLEEEKQFFNQKLNQVIFKTYLDEKEEVKSLLYWLSLKSKKLFLMASKNMAAPFREFLDEYPDHKVIEVETRKMPETRAKITNHNGFISDDRLKGLLPQSYSVSSLKQYQNCPYGFLLKSCLSLRPDEADSVELTAQQQGELIHHILFKYFSAKVPGTQSKKLAEILTQSFGLFTDRFRKEILAPDCLRVEQTVAAFIEIETQRIEQSSYKPAYFELAFGRDKPFEIMWKGKNIRLRGKIDRIDIDEKQKSFKVIDYKTGSLVASSKEVLEGRDFQLMIYALATQKLFLKDYFPAQGYFHRVKELDVKKGFHLEDISQWEILKKTTLENMFRVISDIEQLKFEATPPKCYSNCELKTTCENR